MLESESARLDDSKYLFVIVGITCALKCHIGSKTTPKTRAAQSVVLNPKITNTMPAAKENTTNQVFSFFQRNRGSHNSITLVIPSVTTSTTPSNRISNPKAVIFGKNEI